ncbi:MAG: hypothetical protein QGI83_21840 [Candidatus Latescibacteria bacterium]|nr:hypothetical protein [Candidatus Latescibacterota bacterium]
MVRGLVTSAALVVVLGAGTLPCAAVPTLETGVNLDTITVGDPVTFRVRVRRAQDDRTELLQGSDWPSPLEILDAFPPSLRELEDGRIEEIADYIVTAYRTGELEVAPLALWFRTASGDSGRLTSEPVHVVVLSVLGEDESDIRDIRDPVEMRTRVPLWFWGVLIGLIGAAVALWWYLRHRTRQAARGVEIPPVDWYAELEKIARMGLVERGEYKKYYTMVSDVVRRHLEGRSGVEAMESTTFEVAWRLRQTRVSDAYVSDLEAFLGDADLVKFAKSRPPVQAAQGAVDRARELMRRTDTEHRPRQDGEGAAAPVSEAGQTP